MCQNISQFVRLPIVNIVSIQGSNYWTLDKSLYKGGVGTREEMVRIEEKARAGGGGGGRVGKYWGEGTHRSPFSYDPTIFSLIPTESPEQAKKGFHN